MKAMEGKVTVFWVTVKGDGVLECEGEDDG